MRLVIAAAVACILAGCASTNYLEHKEVFVQGHQISYVYGESRDDNGMHFKVIDRYDSNGRLLARDSVGGDGIVTRVIPAAVSGGLQAGGMIGAAALLPGSNVTQTGGNATSGSSSDSSASPSVNSTVNSSSNSAAASKSDSTAKAKASQTQAQTAKTQTIQNQSQGQTSNTSVVQPAKDDGKKKCR